MNTNSETVSVSASLLPAPVADGGMNLKLITTLCGNSSCPTVYVSDRGTIVVQGFAVSADSAGVDLPSGEMLVEIPAELLAEAARLVP